MTVGRRKQVCRGVQDRPERPAGFFRKIVAAADEIVFSPNDGFRNPRIRKKAIEPPQTGLAGRLAGCHRLKQEIQSFAKLDDLFEGMAGSALAGFQKKFARLLLSDDSGLCGERQKASVRRQEVEKPFAMVSIVQRVREIERQVACNELKFLCHGFAFHYNRP
jgi:hypothetical protein